MCEALQVRRGSYYAWANRPPSAREVKQRQIIEVIRDCHQVSNQTYGSPRILRDLRQRQIGICLKTVAKLMKSADIRAIPEKRAVPWTTDSDHDSPIAPNVLDRDFVADGPNQKWCCDITYILTSMGYLYLSVVIDLYSRRVIGWSMDRTLAADGCISALQAAIRSRRPGAGLVHHSDRGVQYACGDYARILRDNGIQMSMSRRGNCWDNAVAESFFATLKKECVHREKYATIEQASRSIFEYIESWYNRRRRHSSIGYMSPEEFETRRN